MTSPAYLLGGESFLADEALGRLRREIDADPLSSPTFDAASETADIVGALSTPSLLGGRRVVVVRDAGDLKKDAVESLIAYLDSPSPDSVLILVGDVKGKLATKVKEAGTVLGLEAPKGRRLVSWIRERATARELKFDDRAGWALIDAVGNELRDLDGALEQLATGLGPGAKVGQAEVRRAFPRFADERIYAFQDAIGDRRLPVAMATLRRLLEQGDAPLAVFGALSTQVRRMLTARRLADDGGARAIGRALGMPDWRAERLHKQVRTFREEELVAAMKVLAETDHEMKGGDLPPEIALERAVVQIVTGQQFLPA